MNSFTIKLSLLLLVATIGYSNADSSATLSLPGLSSSFMNSGRGLMNGMVNNMASRVSSGEFQPAPVVTINTQVEQVKPGMFGRLRNSLSNRMGGVGNMIAERGVTWGVGLGLRYLGYSGGPYTMVPALAWPFIQPMLRPTFSLKGRILRTIGRSKINMIKFIIRIPGLIFKMVKNIFSQVYYSAKRNNVTPMGFLKAGRLGITGKADRIPTAPIPGDMRNAAKSALAAKFAAEQQMINSMGNTAGQAYNSMGNMAGQAYNSMGNAAESALEAKLAAERKMMNSIGNAAGQAYNSMGNMAGQAYNSMGNMAGNLGAQLPSVQVKI
ncbi:uncharacterized protein LOC141856101 isoform X1 [Brevipalpus obovatus]|uniref:uncharacterized protein LOC141856101 isoform X1 n=1 Tax=Brevipalpus obovatus TaxID=246614 RepID=UPI003D9E4BCC